MIDRVVAANPLALGGTMSDGITVLPGAGQSIRVAGMTLKLGSAQTPTWSAFETVVTPGFDVGAQVAAPGGPDE